MRKCFKTFLLILSFFFLLNNFSFATNLGERDFNKQKGLGERKINKKEERKEEPKKQEQEREKPKKQKQTKEKNKSIKHKEKTKTLEIEKEKEEIKEEIKEEKKEEIKVEKKEEVKEEIEKEEMNKSLAKEMDLVYGKSNRFLTYISNRITNYMNNHIDYQPMEIFPEIKKESGKFYSSFYQIPDIEIKAFANMMEEKLSKRLSGSDRTPYHLLSPNAIGKDINFQSMTRAEYADMLGKITKLENNSKYLDTEFVSLSKGISKASPTLIDPLSPMEFVPWKPVNFFDFRNSIERLSREVVQSKHLRYSGLDLIKYRNIDEMLPISKRNLVSFLIKINVIVNNKEE